MDRVRLLTTEEAMMAGSLDEGKHCTDRRAAKFDFLISEWNEERRCRGQNIRRLSQSSI